MDALAEAVLAGGLRYPVLRGDPQDVLAVQSGRKISRAEFARDVLALAKLLPDRAHVLNLCTDRYRFLVGFAAALQRRQVSLLPSSIAPGVLRELEADFPDVYALTDGVRPELAVLEFPELPSNATDAVLADVPEDQLVLLLFTSGSTGRPKPVPKCWGKLVQSALAAGERLGGEAIAGATIIGTVPHQHSYGFESIILLCLQCGLQLDASWPLYPADIRAAIEQAGQQRVLVTTPVHLRALLAEPNDMPAVDLILSATAPLPVELAVQAEAVFGGRLVEIYGCTEAGQVATRRSAVESDWHCLDGVALRADGDSVIASGVAVQGDALLHDKIEFLTANRFLLGERSVDLVEVAGKRASLAQLNRILLSIPGVQDGVFLMGEAQGAQVTRLMAVAVARGLRKAELMQAMRERMDAAFLPRPMVLVDALPRNALGKLPRAALLDIVREGTRK